MSGELPPELQVFLEAHPDWQHVVFMRRHVLLQLVKVEEVEEKNDTPANT